MRQKFSIVSSFFGDDPSYIHRLYDCVKSQNVDWEWIVTDDFSDNPETEKTLIEICELDNRVKIVTQKHKRELYQNPTVYSDGEFIFHIDGDDIFDSKYLENCLYWFNKFPDVVLILSASKWMKKSGQLERYFIHTPFMNPSFINGQVLPALNFLGRVWRSNIKIDWTDIFSDSKNMIRRNDLYISHYLSTKGEVLCLPRCFVQYETGKISNSNKERTAEEIKLIQQCDSEFDLWFENNKTYYSYNTHFCTGLEIDFEFDCFPFLTLDWNTSVKRIGLFGFSDKIVKRKLIKELYRDYEIVFEPKSTSECDVVVIDGRNILVELPPNMKVHIYTNNTENFNWYYSKMSSRFYHYSLNEHSWIISL
jgi:hypothetical protein